MNNYTGAQLANKKRFVDRAVWTAATVVLIGLLIVIVAKLQDSQPADSGSISVETDSQLRVNYASANPPPNKPLVGLEVCGLATQHRTSDS